MNLYAILFSGIGLFTVVSAAADWDFFMNNRRAAFFVRVMGRNGARLFYILFGLGFIIFGVFGAFGIINLSG